MPRPKKEKLKAEIKPVLPVVSDPVPVSKGPRVDNTVVNVLVGSSFVRQYSLKDHGPDFVEKAKGFAAKKKGTYQFPILT